MDKRRLKVRNRIAHRKHQLTGIHANSNGATNRDFRLCRIESPSPLTFFAGNRQHLILQDNIAHIGEYFSNSRIPHVCTGLKANHRAVVVESKRSNFGTIPRIVKVLAPMFSTPRPRIVARIQGKLTYDRIDSKRMNRIRHGIQHVERIGIVAPRKVRITGTMNIHGSPKDTLSNASIQRNFSLRSIIERQVMDCCRCGKSF